MKTVDDKGARAYQLDDSGFIVDPWAWDEGIARKYAQQESCPRLQDDHWRLILFARQHFLARGQAPMPPDYAKYANMSVGQICGLFPRGLMSIARLAGLPQPKSC